MSNTVGYSEEHKNSRKILKETNDCTVMAWANCFDCNYESAHAWLKRFGRFNRRGMTTEQIKKALQACTKAKIKIGPYSRNNKINLNKFLKKHNSGRYYVLVRGHALCVKDGILYDHSERLKRQVIFACRVYLEGEI